MFAPTSQTTTLVLNKTLKDSKFLDCLKKLINKFDNDLKTKGYIEKEDLYNKFDNYKIEYDLKNKIIRTTYFNKLQETTIKLEE